MRTSEKTDKIFPALFEATGELGNVKKTKNNDFFKGHKYVPLDMILNVTRPILTSHGLFVLQSPSFDGDRVVEVETQIIHAESNQFVSIALATPVDKQNAQGVGSAITYMRRYGLMSLLGIAETDDDGNAANQTKADLGPSPMGKDFVAEPAEKPMTQYAFKRTTAWEDAIAAMETCQTIGELEQWHRESEGAVAEWPRNSRLSLQELYETRVKDFEDFIPNEKDAFAL